MKNIVISNINKEHQEAYSLSFYRSKAFCMSYVGKALISMLIIMVFSANSFSQAYKSYKPIRLGLKASPNIGWISPETPNYSSDGLRVGLSYGLIADFAIAANYYVGSGIQISHHGGEVSIPGENYNYEDSDNSNDEIVRVDRLYQLQYLDIPLTLKLLTNEIGYITYFGQFGVGLGANLSAKGEDILITETTEHTISDPDIKSDISFIRASLIIGLGLEYSLAENASILFGVEYNNGFTNLIKSKPELVDKHNATTDYIQLTIGILF